MTAARMMRASSQQEAVARSEQSHVELRCHDWAFAVEVDGETVVNG
jgi:hypothetical protein